MGLASFRVSDVIEKNRQRCSQGLNRVNNGSIVITVESDVNS